MNIDNHNIFQQFYCSAEPTTRFEYIFPQILQKVVTLNKLTSNTDFNWSTKVIW